MDEKRYIPGTNPKHGFEVPEGWTNSMVDTHGRNVDTGHNFDERDDESEATQLEGGEAEAQDEQGRTAREQAALEMAKAATAASELEAE